MAFITGLFLIDAPASALNNGQADNNISRIKSINVPGQGRYAYNSAQSYRYWLRDTLKANDNWQASPVYTGGAGKKQQAFTAGNPLMYADDDLFGYMRAEKKETVTRVSPFRTSTLVSITPVRVVEDFGVMARVEKEEGDKEGVVLHGHEFYRATLQGLFSLDLNAAGTFTNQMRSGYQNLGEETIAAAEAQGLEKLDELKAYRLPIAERLRRVQMLLQALTIVDGGAKQALHYTDVSPVFMIAAVTHGGNNIFGRIITTDEQNHPVIHEGVMEELKHITHEDLLSPVYVGRAAGFMDGQDTMLKDYGLSVVHPRQAMADLAAKLAANPQWMD